MERIALGGVALALGMAAAFAPSCVQAKTYTPAQLKAMVHAGHYPAQGKVTTRKTDMDFPACVQSARNVVESIGANYPVKLVASTAAMKVVKIWTNDGAITVTCSGPDRTMVITQAPYI